jgi:O-antigen ligase
MKLTAIERICDVAIFVCLIALTVILPVEKHTEFIYYELQVIMILTWLTRLTLRQPLVFWGNVLWESGAAFLFVSIVALIFSTASPAHTIFAFFRNFAIFVVALILVMNVRFKKLQTENPMLRYPVVLAAPLVFFLLVCLLSGLCSEKPGTSLATLRGKFGFSFFIYLIAATQLLSLESIKRIVFSFYLVGLLVAGLGITEYLLYHYGDFSAQSYLLRQDAVAHADPTDMSSPVRIQFPFRTHMLMACYLMLICMIVPLQYYLTITRTRRHWVGVSFILPYSALLMTQSRPGIAGALAGMALFFFLTRKRHVFALILIIIATYLVAPFNIRGRLASLVSPSTYFGEQGVLTATRWTQAERSLRQRPLIGIGMGGSQLITSSWHEQELQMALTSPVRNNAYAQLLVETGIAGLLSMLAFFAILGYMFVRKIARQKSRTYLRSTGIGFLSLLVALAIYALGTHTLHQLLDVYVWIVLGILTAYLLLVKKIPDTVETV